MTTLRPEHGAYLQARAVPIDVALDAGLYSATAEEVAELLGMSSVASGGIAIPYPGIDPPYHRVRMDDGDAKFLAPAGRGAPIYIPQAAGDGPLLVVEGPIKCLAATAHGFRGVGLGGAETGLTRDRLLDPSWGALELATNEVVLVPDADIATNYSVMRGQARLALALTQGGASVRVALLPGPGKQGPDDFLAEHGGEALREIIGASTPACPSERIAHLSGLSAEQRKAAIALLLADKVFLVSLLQWGEAVKFTVRSEFRGATKALDSALNEIAKELGAANRRDAASADTAVYREIRGALHRVYTTRDGLEEKEQLSNFTAQIIKESTLDDGVERQKLFEIVGADSTGRELPAVQVTADEFATKSWHIAKWGARAVVMGSAGAMSHTRAAIQLFSPNVEIVNAYSHTGFREFESGLTYLHAGGAVGAANVVVQVDGSLARYRLPDERGDVRSAVLYSLRLLDVASDPVSVPLFCSAYLAPLSHWISIGFATWAWGKTGTFKSSVAALCQAHFGDFDAQHLPGSWLSTAPSLETLLSRAKDALTVVDDFVPKSAHELDEMRRKAAQVIRAIGNNAARGRMRPDLTARPDRPPRGLVIVTGEDLLSGESSSARTFTVRFEPGSVDKGVLSQLQRKAKRFPTAMRAYVEHLIEHDAWLRANAETRVEALRDSFRRQGIHARTPDAAARLMFAGEVFVDFAAQAGLLDAANAQALVARIRAALLDATSMHATGSEDRKPTTRFFATLEGLLAQRKVVLLRNPKETVESNAGPGETVLGCRDSDRIFLLPDVTYGAVLSAMRSAGESFPTTAEGLWQELKSQGLLAAYDPGRTTLKRTVGGRRVRVLEVWASVIDGAPDDEPPPDPGGAPGAPRMPRNCDAAGARASAGYTGTCPGPAPTAPPENRTDTYVRGPAPMPGNGAGAQVRDAHYVPPKSGAIGARDEKAQDSRALARPRVGSPGGAPVGQQAMSDFCFVSDAADLPALAEAVAAADSVALDTETTGLDPLLDWVRLVQLGLPDGRIYVVDVWATGGLGPVAEVLGRVPWLGHHLQFDIAMMRQLDAHPPKVICTQLLAQVLDCGLHLTEKGYFTLAALLQRHLGVEMSKKEQQSDWSGELRPEQFAYAALDVAHLHRLAAALTTRIAARDLTSTAALECDVLPAVVDMQLAGVAFDRGRWAALTDEKRREAAQAKQFVERELQITNANSAKKQLLPAMQERLGSGVVATNGEALAPFASDPVVRSLQQFRVAAAFVRNHGEPFLVAMNEYPDGRVRSQWRQIGTTGRMTCSDPPMLNLPRSHDVRACVVAPPNCVLIVADYGQIELRVLAQVAVEERLLEVFRTGGDPHRTTAALIAGVSEHDVTTEQRSRAKPINFGFAFGMGAKRFVGYALKDYGVVFTLAEATHFRNAYLRAYPGVARWHKVVGSSMPAEMRTVGGRIRAFPDRRSGYSHRLNHPIQGTALDGFKAAMAILSPRLAAAGARVVLAVHDELLVEAPEDRAEEVRTCVEAGMVEGMSRFVTAVPVKVDAKVVKNWAGAK